MARHVILFIAGLLLAPALDAQGRCPASDFPPGDHTADLYVDSVAFTAVLTSSWSQETQLGIAYLGYDEEAEKPSVGIRLFGASSEDRDALKALLERHLRDVTKDDAGLQFFLGDADGPRFRSVARVPTCAPIVRNPRFVQQMIAREAEKLRFERRVRTVIWAHVDEEGDVIETRIAESSGDMSADRTLLRLARSIKFKPGEIAGFPIAVWVQYPITLARPR